MMPTKKQTPPAPQFNQTRKNEAPLAVDQDDLDSMLGANPTLGGKQLSRNAYNSWPDAAKWPMLSARYITDPLDMEDLMSLKEHSRTQTFRQVDPDTVPYPIRGVSRSWESRYHDAYQNWHFYQGVDGLVVCVLKAERKYVTEFSGTWRHQRDPGFEEVPYKQESRYMVQRPMVVVVLGCDHDMHGWNLGRCWNASKCQKCGYYTEVDSSD